jgi:hypothetical protein
MVHTYCLRKNETHIQVKLRLNELVLQQFEVPGSLFWSDLFNY